MNSYGNKRVHRFINNDYHLQNDYCLFPVDKNMHLLIYYLDYLLIYSLGQGLFSHIVLLWFYGQAE